MKARIPPHRDGLGLLGFKKIVTNVAVKYYYGSLVYLNLTKKQRMAKKWGRLDAGDCQNVSEVDE